MWWNSSAYIVKLKLSSEQRAGMDEAFQSNKERSQATSASDRKLYYEAIEAGDWKAAEEHLTAFTDADREAARSDGEMRIGVLSLLNKEQLDTLLEVSGNLIRRPWFKRMGWPIRSVRNKPTG